MLDGNRRALARLFTLLEQDRRNLAAIVGRLPSGEARAHCVGVTGPPGAGKSTLIDALSVPIRRRGDAIGVLVVDPTSPYSGGAVLGDRIRMQSRRDDEGVFIRSLATRGARGGLSPVVGAGIRLLEAAGMDYVLVETVGVGQTELDVRGLADTVVVTLVPDGGDSIQAMKAGLSEIADVFVVNKADRPGAGRLAAHVAASLELDPPGSPWRPPVLELQAHRGVGVPALWDAIARHRQAVGSSALLGRRRRARARQELASALAYAVEGPARRSAVRRRRPCGRWRSGSNRATPTPTRWPRRRSAREPCWRSSSGEAEGFDM